MKEWSHCYSGCIEKRRLVQPWWREWKLIYPFYGIILQEMTRALKYSYWRLRIFAPVNLFARSKCFSVLGEIGISTDLFNWKTKKLKANFLRNKRWLIKVENENKKQTFKILMEKQIYWHGKCSVEKTSSTANRTKFSLLSIQNT